MDGPGAVAGDGGNTLVGQNFCAVLPRLAGEGLQQKVGVDVPGVVGVSGEGDGRGVDDRHHRLCFGDGDRVDAHVGDVVGEGLGLVPPPEDQEAAQGQEVVLAVEIIARGQRQGDDGGSAVAGFVKRRRAARGVVGQVRLGFQQQDGAQMRQSGGGGDSGDAAADDEEIVGHGPHPAMAGGRGKGGAGEGLRIRG